MRRALAAIHRGMDRLVDAVHVLAALITGLFLLLTFAQVVMRYAFNSPIYGVDEYVLALMVWANALGFVVVYWHNEHAMIEFVVRRVPGPVKTVIYWITNLCILIVSAIFVPGGITLFGLQVKTAPRMGLPFPKAYYLALPMVVMGMLMVLLCGFRTVEYGLTRDNGLMNALPEEGVVRLD